MGRLKDPPAPLKSMRNLSKGSGCRDYRFPKPVNHDQIILSGYPLNRLTVESPLNYLKFLSLQSQTQGLACSVIDLRLVSGTKTSSRSVRRSLWSTLTDSTLFSRKEREIQSLI